MLIGHQPKEFLLAVEALTVSFDGFKAVNDLSFYVDENEIRVIIGPNGAGKTTVLDLICGKTKATSGKIHFRDFLDTLLHRRVALEGQRAEHGAAARIGNLEILEHGEVDEHRRRLELAADAGLHDLVLLQPGELLAAKLDRAGGRLGLAADQIEHRGLAGAVGANDDADLVLLDIEGEIVDRLETVEGNRERFDREQEFLGLMTDEH